MRKLVFLCRRRSDIDHAEYERRVLTGHVPLALRHHSTMRHYVVNIVDRVQVPGSPEIDAVAELSFDTMGDYRERLYDSPEGEKIIGRDVAGFMGGADAYECTPHVHKGPVGRRFGHATPGVKLVAGIRRNPSLTHEEFVEHWLTRHVPLALEHHLGLTHYVTNVVDARLSDSGADFDGIGELGFASEDDLTQKMFGLPDSREVIEADIARFIGSMQGWVAIEYPQK